MVLFLAFGTGEPLLGPAPLTKFPDSLALGGKLGGSLE